MSTMVYGRIEFVGELTTVRLTEYAFCLSLCALQTGFNLNLGGNVDLSVNKLVKSRKGIIAFEITDDPLSNTAEYLFSGDGVTIRMGTECIGNEESLRVRMKKVQSLINTMLMESDVGKIVMYVNIGYGDIDESITIHCYDFSDKLVELFEREENWTPVVELVIIR